jgi:hypothetical protein
MPQFSDDLFLGPAIGPQASNQGAGNPSVPDRGVGPLGRVYVFDVVPATLSATAVCAVQASTGANNPLTINGASASGGVATLDVCRALSMIGTNAGDTTQTVTVTGTDFYGRTQTEARTLNGTTIVNFLKAFKTVTGVRVSATLAGNISVGSRDAIGLPYRVTNAAYIAHVGWNSALARDAGTFVAAVTTDPNTSALGDVRGTYLPSSAADGSKRLVMVLALPALAVGPNATTVGAIGVTPA